MTVPSQSLGSAGGLAIATGLLPRYCRVGIVTLFENGWDAVDVSGLGGVICWLTVVFHAAAATVISSQTAKRLVISIRQCGALIR